MIILGLTGSMGSGKSTIVNILKEKYGYKHITLSDAIRDECKKRGLKEDRITLMDVAEELRNNFGTQILAERALEKINKSHEYWIIDGIRNPGEIKILRKNPNFILIGNHANKDLIIKRIKSRQRDGDSFDEEGIRQKLKKEWGENEPEDGQQVGKCMKMVDYTFENNMPIEELEDKFIKFYENIINQK